MASNKKRAIKSGMRKSNADDIDDSGALLYCPVRGPLNAKALAKDGLTPTEEARRVDFIRFLIEEREYPSDHIRVEVVTIKNLGESGRNTLRADVIVYDRPARDLVAKTPSEQLEHVALVAEIKREAAKKTKGVSYQLEPAIRVLPRIDTLGVYWDDENRILFTKSVHGKGSSAKVLVSQDSIANLPDYGSPYESKPITVDVLTQPANLVATLFGLANVMRSHGVNDEHLRYKETVKLLLARYVDEKLAKASKDKQVRLQVLEGDDHNFMSRVQEMYRKAATRYNRAQTLFHPSAASELEERTLRDLVKSIEGFDLSSASNDTMQQVFMSFVPAVFKKSLDQYFTPVSLINTMVEMVAPGPTDKIADPAMGTGDFLTSAMAFCIKRGDDDAFSRVYGVDSDQKAYDLAIVNMILNRDGQANLIKDDSIANSLLWANEMDVVLCNPPFGSRTVENRTHVLEHYDLGHVWSFGNETWKKTDEIATSQQLGILFVERCFKMLRPGGRMAIILPEGYLSTATYGYVRQWLIDNFVIRSLVELPRRIFAKSGADLRSNILVAEKRRQTKVGNYPVHASMVRRVGYKMGGDFGLLPLRDRETGIPIRDGENKLTMDSHFHRVVDEFRSTPTKPVQGWSGASLKDITERIDLDMKPRRLVPRALSNVRELRSSGAVKLGEIATVLETTVDLISDVGPAELRRAVEGQDIRAIEGIVVPQFAERCWSIAERKQRKVYELRSHDIIVGLVRPERRNIGILLDSGDDIVGSPDGLAVVRIRPELAQQYPTAWLFAALRSEPVRLQLWTEAGGTSYGKLTVDQIKDTLVPIANAATRQSMAHAVLGWMENVSAMHRAWNGVGTEDDRRPILNSPLVGLFDPDGSEDGDDE